jgi:NitT/TauT family transport system permease protein
VLALLRRTRLLRFLAGSLGKLFFAITGLRLRGANRQRRPQRAAQSSATDLVFYGGLGLVMLWAVTRIVAFCLSAHLAWSDLGEALLMGVFTMIRVVVLMALATLLWVPVGVAIGLRPRWARGMGAAAQFLAAFPANLFYPIFVVMIVRHALNPDIWLTPLIILGTQWYIAFNVIAGAAAFPGDLQEAAKNFHVGGLLWWRRVILPGIFPYFVTGAITASGGSWNASLLAETATWGTTTLRAHGLGAYIQDATTRGDTARVLLGMVVMAGFVLTFNRLVWRPMYAYSSKRLRL